MPGSVAIRKEGVVGTRYELRAVFEVTDEAALMRYARKRHRACYPPATKHALPRPRRVTDGPSP